VVHDRPSRADCYPSAVRRPAALIIVLLLLALTPATLLAHPGGDVDVEVAPSRPGPGDTVRVSGEGFRPRADVILELLTADGAVEVGRPATDDDGHFEAAVGLPVDLPQRAYELRATGADGVAASGYLTITGPTPPPESPGPGAELPSLGDLAPLLAGLAAAILLLGLAARSAVRR
jgi:hypothetical protein